GFVHVGLVVLVVVEFHRLLVDVRLEGVVGVGERGNGIGHFRCSLSSSPGRGTPAVLSEAHTRSGRSGAPFCAARRPDLYARPAYACRRAASAHDPAVRLSAAHREGAARRRGGALTPAHGARGPGPPDGGRDVDLAAGRLARA